MLFLVWGNKHWSIQSIFPATHEWDSASFPANLLPGYIILQFNSPSSAFHFLFINYSLICNHNLNCLTSIVKCHFSYFLGQWMKHEASKGKRMQCVFVFVHACACVCFFKKKCFCSFPTIWMWWQKLAHTSGCDCVKSFFFLHLRNEVSIIFKCSDLHHFVLC